MKISSIDIGSNTVLMLIAEFDTEKKRLFATENFYEMPRISRDLLPGRPISEEKIGELLAILARFTDISRTAGSDKIIVNATNAFRIASNTPFIIDTVRKKLGLDIRVLSGEEEAYFSYLGAVSGYQSDVNNLVVDIGGGSTELIYGKNKKISFAKSTNLGVVGLTNEFFKKDPPDEDEISECISGILRILTRSNLKIGDEFETIAVAGTPTTLACIKHGIMDYDENIVEGTLIRIGELEEIISGLKNMKSSLIREKYGGVTEGRADILLAGALVLYNIARYLDIKAIKVSNRGLRYGAILADSDR